MYGGWSVDRFTVPMDHYICAICREVYKDAVSNNCGHTFCKKCISRVRGQCPVCKEQIVMQSPDFSVRKIIATSPFRCEYVEHGCEFISTITDIHNHQLDCSYKHIPCEKCETIIKMIDMEKHVNEDCIYRNIQCDQCFENVSFDSLDKHKNTVCLYQTIECIYCICSSKRHERHEKSCEEMIVPCKYVKYGCKYESKRKEIKDHEQTNHTDVLCDVLDRQLSLFTISHLHDGPFRIIGHPHRVYLCSDLDNDTCMYCHYQITDIQSNGLFLGYTCGHGCPFVLCINCIGKRRLYKSKRNIASTMLFSL